MKLPYIGPADSHHMKTITENEAIFPGGCWGRTLKETLKKKVLNETNCYLFLLTIKPMKMSMNFDDDELLDVDIFFG